jgi:Na+-translocating ferredoxin:NAD+ oxidoreductase RNF subunit RnfB
LFETLLPAFISLVIIAGLAALVISLASKRFRVEQDPRVNKVLEALPGANCGGCGHAGCGAFAESVVHGIEGVCPVADAAAKRLISQVMGKEDQSDTETETVIARVFCQGTYENAVFNVDYKGVADCRAAKQFGTSDKACKYACYGFGTCQKACPFDAIEMKNGIAVINRDKCTSCGKCVAACPQSLITIVPKRKTTTITCHSNDKGAVAKSNCKVACIGCMKCVKECPVQAISVSDFLAKIDYTKCVNCKKCIKVCPMGTIRELA